MQASKLNQLPLAEALLIGEKVVEQLAVACERIEIVGSIRRKSPLVHDLDLVVIPQGKWIKNKKDEIVPFPNNNQWFDIPRLIKDLDGEIINSGDKLITAVVEDFQLDINCARKDNWGILYLLKTGPQDFNIQLCNRALRLGKHLMVYFGIWKGEKRFPAEVEIDIFNALELEFIPPVDRDAAVARLRSGTMV